MKIRKTMKRIKRTQSSPFYSLLQAKLANRFNHDFSDV